MSPSGPATQSADLSKILATALGVLRFCVGSLEVGILNSSGLASWLWLLHRVFFELVCSTETLAGLVEWGGFGKPIKANACIPVVLYRDTGVTGVGRLGHCVDVIVGPWTGASGSLHLKSRPLCCEGLF